MSYIDKEPQSTQEFVISLFSRQVLLQSYYYFPACVQRSGDAMMSETRCLS